mgnify:CR=1 FL=1
MKGLLALITYFVPDFANDGLYTLLYTVADGFFYFLPVALAFSAARKFRMNEFTGVAIGVALLYPTMVALTRARRSAASTRRGRHVLVVRHRPRDPHHHARVRLRELGDPRPSHGVVRLYP